MKNHEYLEIELEASGLRLDQALADYLIANEYITTRSELSRIFKTKLVFIADKNPKAGLKIDRKTKLGIYLPQRVEMSYEAEKMPLDIRYEDEHILVINKERGIVVHPALGHPNHTLVNGLLYYLGNNLSNINGDFRPGIVHRIDKDTSGLLLIAKTNKAHNLFAAQLKNHEIKRTYYGLAHGLFSSENGTIDAPIGRDPNYRQKMAVVPSGKEAVTHFKVLEQFHKLSFLELELETGRTHQIRVHLNYIKHPLVGDLLYAPKRQNYELEGQALHAGKLKFFHPFLNKNIMVEAELPSWFEKVLDKLRN